MSIKESISWTNMTLNPIKGRCKGGCWYCFYSGKRGIMNRFKHNPEIRLDLTVFDNLPKKPKKIFLCSTHDLFGDWIPGWYRDLIFTKVEEKFWHTFQILTKFPQNIDRDMPNNVHLGVTLDGIDPLDDIAKSWSLRDMKAKIKFYSFEPLIDPPCLKLLYIVDWVIIGKLTSYGKQFNPKKRWIEEIVDEYKSFDIPIFLKDNLKEIWGNDLIQEFPDV